MSQENMGFIYSLCPREFLKSVKNIIKIGRDEIRTNKDLLKIGKTDRTMEERFNEYPKGSELIYYAVCQNIIGAEYAIIKYFAEKYTQCLIIGTEYFLGSKQDMINDIRKIVYSINSTEFLCEQQIDQKCYPNKQKLIDEKNYDFKLKGITKNSYNFNKMTVVKLKLKDKNEFKNYNKTNDINDNDNKNSNNNDQFILPFKNEDIPEFNYMFIEQILHTNYVNPYSAFKELIKEIYLNPDMPQNQNIKITSTGIKKGQIYNGINFVTMFKRNLYDELCIHLHKIIIKNIKKFKNKLHENLQKSFIEQYTELRQSKSEMRTLYSDFDYLFYRFTTDPKQNRKLNDEIVDLTEFGINNMSINEMDFDKACIIDDSDEEHFYDKFKKKYSHEFHIEIVKSNKHEGNFNYAPRDKDYKDDHFIKRRNPFREY